MSLNDRTCVLLWRFCKFFITFTWQDSKLYFICLICLFWIIFMKDRESYGCRRRGLHQVNANGRKCYWLSLISSAVVKLISRNLTRVGAKVWFLTDCFSLVSFGKRSDAGFISSILGSKNKEKVSNSWYHDVYSLNW